MRLWALAALAAVIAAPAAAQNDELSRMLRGESAMQGKKLEKALEKAAKHPLGSRENPVRAAMPQGQRAYLARLRCSDGKAPRFERAGNLGPGVYDNIVDLYIVECPGAQPARSEVVMDMYHAGYVELRAVPGFTIVAEGAAPVAAAPAPDSRLSRMARGESYIQGAELDALIAKAEEHPLGSKENPIRVSRPAGQRAYLAKLRCADGTAPQFYRRGNIGIGVFGNIVDVYLVECRGSEPATSEVVMDMYHLNRTEDRAVPGFSIVGSSGAPTTKRAPAGMPTGAPPPPSQPTQTRVAEPTG